LKRRPRAGIPVPYGSIIGGTRQKVPPIDTRSPFGKDSGEFSIETESNQLGTKRGRVWGSEGKVQRAQV